MAEARLSLVAQVQAQSRADPPHCTGADDVLSKFMITPKLFQNLTGAQYATKLYAGVQGNIDLYKGDKRWRLADIFAAGKHRRLPPPGIPTPQQIRLALQLQPGCYQLPEADKGEPLPYPMSYTPPPPQPAQQQAQQPAGLPPQQLQHAQAPTEASGDVKKHKDKKEKKSKKEKKRKPEGEAGSPQAEAAVAAADPAAAGDGGGGKRKRTRGAA